MAADVTRMALEVLFVLTVGPKAQLALCEEIQLPSGEHQKGMRYEKLERAMPCILPCILLNSFTSMKILKKNTKKKY